MNQSKVKKQVSRAILRMHLNKLSHPHHPQQHIITKCIATNWKTQPNAKSLHASRRIKHVNPVNMQTAGLAFNTKQEATQGQIGSQI